MRRQEIEMISIGRSVILLIVVLRFVRDDEKDADVYSG